MNSELYNQLVSCVRKEPLPSGPNNNNLRRRLKYAAVGLDVIGHRLKKGDKILLRDTEVISVINHLHVRLGHVKSESLFEEATALFIAPDLREVCRSVVVSCDSCNENILHHRSTGPMLHYSLEKRKKLCLRLNLTWIDSLDFVNSPDINPSKFEPIIFDSKSDFNCFCSAFCTILTGNSDQAGAIEDFILKQREGAYKSLFESFGGVKPWEDKTEKLKYVTSTDIRILARLLSVNFYEYHSSGNAKGKWLQYSGNHQGPEDGGFYIAAVYTKNSGHSVVVLGLKER